MIRLGVEIVDLINITRLVDGAVLADLSDLLLDFLLGLLEFIPFFLLQVVAVGQGYHANNCPNGAA